MIVQTASHGASGATDISFTTDKADLLKTRKVLDSIKGEVGFNEAITDEKIGKLSIVGVGMRSHTGVAAKMFETLAQCGVNIDMISTSEIKISVVISLDKGEQAMKAVHAAFLG
jgi:aspartate kinase